MNKSNPPVPPETDNQPIASPAPPKVEGEGSYTAAKDYDDKVTDFVEQRGDEVEGLARKASEALDGPEGDELRAAEQEARDRVAKE
ncbi:MAG: hypothetical protein ABI673_00580 [Novosphingobium sp.]